MARNKKIEVEEVKQKPVKEDPIKTLQESVNKLTIIMTRIEQRLSRFCGGF